MRAVKSVTLYRDAIRLRQGAQQRLLTPERWTHFILGNKISCENRCLFSSPTVGEKVSYTELMVCSPNKILMEQNDRQGRNFLLFFFPNVTHLLLNFSFENVVKNQDNISQVMILLNLITCLLDNVWKSQREFSGWSLQGFYAFKTHTHLVHDI